MVMARKKVAWIYKTSEYVRRKNLRHYHKKNEKLAGRPRPNNCELCGRVGWIVFDHNHETDKFRGWICSRCNTALGLANDEPKIVELWLEYLKRHQKKII